MSSFFGPKIGSEIAQQNMEFDTFSEHKLLEIIPRRTEGDTGEHRTEEDRRPEEDRGQSRVEKR